MPDLTVLHHGAKSGQARELAAAINRRLTARHLQGRRVKVYDGRMTLTAELLEAAITAAWSLGAQRATLDRMRDERIVTVGAARMIRNPGRRTAAQRDLGARRVAALVKARKRRAARAAAKDGRDVALAWARSKIGIREQPAGSNGNPANVSQWQASLGFGRVPWCGIFCAKALQAAGVDGVTSKLASVALIEDDARSQRAPFTSWSSSRGRPGDLVVIGGRGVHVELVKQSRPDGSCSTIGGNTSLGTAGSQANGGMVAGRIRSAREITGYAHVRYP